MGTVGCERLTTNGRVTQAWLGYVTRACGFYRREAQVDGLANGSRGSRYNLIFRLINVDYYTEDVPESRQLKIPRPVSVHLVLASHMP